MLQKARSPASGVHVRGFGNGMGLAASSRTKHTAHDVRLQALRAPPSTLEAALDRLVAAEASVEQLKARNHELEERSRQQQARFVTVEVAAWRLGKHERTIRRWIERGTIPCSKIGRQWQLDMELLLARPGSNL